MKQLRTSQKAFRFVVRTIFRCFYRIRVFGRENMPADGGVLLMPNHVSWIDGFLIMMMTQRPVCMLVHAENFQSGFMKWWAQRWDAILISGGPKSIVRALQRAQTALQNGEVVCIFAEGGITRTGQLQSFRPGFMKTIAGTDAVVVPVYVDELWGSIFSFSGGKFFFKWPKRWRYPVSIYYGVPLRNLQDRSAVRQAVQELGSEAVKHRTHAFLSLPHAMLRMCKKRKFKPKIADSNSGEVTGGELLLRTLILRRLLRRHVLAADEKNVGVLLPPSNGGVIANMALALDRRVPINLNYTVSSSDLNACLAAAGIKHVLTSRQVLSKLDLKLAAKVVELEDFKDRVTLSDKIAGALGAFVWPAWLVARLLGLQHIHGHDLATIIFTSGSTGTPKGVMLSYDNIASNVEAIDQVVRLTAEDVIIGVLPFFHSFGYTVTLWTPAALNLKAVYHYSPLDAKRIGMLVKKHGATVILATPTFLRSYIKRCTPEQFKTLDVVVAGAEKLSVALCDAFEEKYGVRPVEGYGCTELSPLVSVNVPPSRSAGTFQIDCKEGSVGRPVPNVSAKIIHSETGETLPAGQDGMLLIKGPNVMQGYLNDPEKTAEVIRDGWYVTGDIGVIDDDGFIHVTGRESRFSKIGGEMVPHIKLEESLCELLGTQDEEGLSLAVTAVPDAKKGERLIVLHTRLEKSPEDLCRQLSQAGLPNLFIPSADSFLQVPEIPVLGTGKLDLRGLKALALERTAGA